VSQNNPQPKARIVYPGAAEGPVLFSPVPFPLSGVTFGADGAVNWDGHPLQDQSIRDKILVVTEVSGFAGGDWALLSLATRQAAAPKAILCGACNSFLIAGAILAKIPTVIDLPLEALRAIGGSSHVSIATDQGAIRYRTGAGESAMVSITRDRQPAGGELRLTDEDQRMLDGFHGQVAAECMKVIVAYAGALGASRLIDIESVHLAGSGYNTTGDVAIDYLDRLVDQGGRVRVPATLNPIAVDLDRWQKPMRLPSQLHEKQQQMNAAFQRLGFTASYSCVPYWTSIAPRFGANIAWAEHNAVSYANSVLGARTNFESNVITLTAAFTGRMPEYGLYKVENRRPQIAIEFSAAITGDEDWRCLGVAAAQRAGDRIPIFLGLQHSPSTHSLRDLCAALGPPWCASPMLHIPGVTPEASRADLLAEDLSALAETVRLEPADLEAVRARFAGDVGMEVDLVALGCPQYSLAEIDRVSTRIAGRHISPRVQLWIWTDPATRAVAERSGLVDQIERAGGYIMSGSCGCAACPIQRSGHAFRTMATDSTKSCGFISRVGIRTLFGSMEDCIESAVRGHWPGRAPTF